MSGALFKRVNGMVAVVSILLLWSSVGWATTYYADNNAAGCSRPDSDYDPATRTCGAGNYQVYYTLQGAANAATSPGDTVLVRSGTYDERITVQASGTSGSPITFRASGAVIMKGFSISHNYIAVDGFEITAATSHGIDVSGNYDEITNNHIHHITGDGSYRAILLSSTASNCLVDNNRINDIGINGQFTPAVTIYGTNHVFSGNEIGPNHHDVFQVWGTGHIIRNNYIHDLSVLDADHIDVIQTYGTIPYASNNWVFERNLVKNSEQQLWNLATNGRSDIHSITIRNNVFINVSQNGNSWVPYTYVYNNTFAYTGNVYFGASSTRGNSYPSEIYNNIFYNQSTAITVCYGMGWGGSPTYTGDHNLVYPYDADCPSETNGINGSAPLFMDVNNDNYHIQTNSPAKDAGTTLSDFSVDKDGVARLQGVWDIGAYEAHGTVAAPSEPLCAPADIVEAESGTLVFPMESVYDASLSGGAYIRTSALDSGTAAYTLSVAETGDYEIRTYAHSADVSANSFYFSFDGLNEDTWDMFYEGTSFGGWAEDYVSRRGTGTVDNPEVDPFVVNLTAGTHTLNLRGREIDSRLDYFCLVKRQPQSATPVPPAPPTGLRIVQVQ